MRKVLVFGIFDILHPGHAEFFKQASKKGDYLIVAVGPDSASKKFKGRMPMHSLADRIKLVSSIKYVSEAVAGDEKQGSYDVVRRKKPDIVYFGYDQKKLAEDFTRWIRENDKNKSIKILFLRPYKSNKYQTRLLRKTHL